MRYRAIAGVAAFTSLLAVAALAQSPNPARPPTASAAQQANVETAEISLVYPDRYAVQVALEPLRRIYVIAPSDGFLSSVTVPVGATVREAQEIGQLDRAESSARLKIAQANVKEAQAELGSGGAIAQAHLEAAKAKADLAQIELDRCILRASFPGRILAAPVSAGQYVNKGNTIAELADVSTLKVLVPVDRTAVTAGTNLDLIVEGKTVSGKVQSVVPLPETYAILRELAVPWAAAWVQITNTSNALEPGQRVRGPYTPIEPITTVPTRAVRPAEGNAWSVQIIRFNNVLDIPVKVLGDAGFDRTQVSGRFLPTDAAIVESSLPLAAGTVIRFSGDPPVSGASPSGNTGSVVDFTPPVGAPVSSRPVGNRVAPIGSPDANLPRTAPGTRPGGTPKTSTPKAATPKAAPPAGGGTPF